MDTTTKPTPEPPVMRWKIWGDDPVHCRTTDPNGEWVKWSEVESLLTAQAQEAETLRGVWQVDLKTAQERVLTLELENRQAAQEIATLTINLESVAKRSDVLLERLHEAEAQLTRAAQEIEQLKALVRLWREQHPKNCGCFCCFPTDNAEAGRLSRPTQEQK